MLRSMFFLFSHIYLPCLPSEHWFPFAPTLGGCSRQAINAECFCHRLRASRVLLVGMKGLGAEVAKNLILAGVKGLTMLDHQQVRTLQLWLAMLPTTPGAVWCQRWRTRSLLFRINILLRVELLHFGACRVCISSHLHSS